MTKPTFIQKALAWSVHIFTASGLLTGFMAILAINEKDWRSTMFWLLAALIIDGIDGTFARMFRVKEVLPYIDGKTIDFTNGIGYIEKDWGKSFPNSWIWMQTNHFKYHNASLMASLSSISLFSMARMMSPFFKPASAAGDFSLTDLITLDSSTTSTPK